MTQAPLGSLHFALLCFTGVVFLQMVSKTLYQQNNYYDNLGLNLQYLSMPVHVYCKKTKCKFAIRKHLNSCLSDITISEVTISKPFYWQMSPY